MSNKEGAAIRPVAQSSRRAERKEERRRLLIAAARSVFHEKGFAAATIDDIMARTGGSRGTLYGHFDGKLALFEAIVEEEAERFAQAVTETIAPAASGDLDAMAERLIAVATSEETIDLLRMVIAERQHYPGIGEIYRQIVPRIQAWMRRMFREQTGASFCRDEAASDFLADMFLAIVLADTQMGILTGITGDRLDKTHLIRTRQRLKALLALRDHLGADRLSELAALAQQDIEDGR
ncbi:helix-turn-helix transcriptional regulator [Sphingomonadales bacterium 56]|uniref:TetR family transcriptional regulator n=8 Tax=Sphingomonadales TaxID=204457 RepID=A0A2S8AZW5_9SPHN|nr:MULTISPECIES: TetR/AcrR family transcriptional regulator [Sphingomonadaceae]AOR81372.1 TetR family transcriptional regulator [Novosphingobium resinovorum]MBY2930922.1 helix-turn-helix transcriptional regulator [Sphingomonadales bacterium 56]MBY2960981.1 helix-turn-helix transcriptional regulator [Sphingomonadales bacterium 58]AMK20261.1 transcriptional regulator, TetR family protein [Sphingobium sp. MI1205]APL96655.1 TetR family transcriptional regulator [Sphingobium indicum B90A]